MSQNRHAAKVDENHRSIVNALRMMGCDVEPIRGKKDIPDLLVGNFGITELIEVKPDVSIKARRELRESQAEWHARWKGRKPVVLRNIEDCVALVARMRGAMTSAEVAR